jgi:RNA polymerase sigma-70 factor (ECF subfamily)
MMSLISEPGGLPSSESGDSLRTRQSLLTRLKDWDDHASWREFFNTYWKLIYSFARRAGLGDADAQDMVQEVLVGVARRMPEFRYDPSKGRFKTWLLTIVRRRLADHWRRTLPDRQRLVPLGEDGATRPEEVDDGLEPVWQEEWNQHLLQSAMARVQKKASARHFLIFDLLVVRQTPAGRVAKLLDVSLPQVWIVRHRLGKLLKEEYRRIEAGIDP